MDIGSYLSLLKTGADCSVGALIASCLCLLIMIIICCQLAAIHREISWSQFKAGTGPAPKGWNGAERQLSAWRMEG